MGHQLALKLAGHGYRVFPVKHDETDNSKTPLTPHGHKDATNDLKQINEWWTRFPEAKVGVPAGVNKIVALDIDTKNGLNGWDELSDNFYNVPETFFYDTSTGGSHYIYSAPENVVLNGVANYRGMQGVDRRGGESWVMWVGDTPTKLSPAPEWLCDPAEKKDLKQFIGSFEEWADTILPGEPGIIVRDALTKIDTDMSHSDMVEQQHYAIRLGCEGQTGVLTLLDALYTAWMSRPTENHTTPYDQWEPKWFEALSTGIEKYGALTAELENLPEYNIGLVPAAIPDSLITNDTGKPGFSRLLGELVKNLANDHTVASILWHAPATTVLAREWGLQFVYHRIDAARIKPEPTRENPRIEDERERVLEHGTTEFVLLTDEEREAVKEHKYFPDRIVDTAISYGYDQLNIFNSIGWVVASMAFAFKNYVPLTRSHKMGVNLWFIVLADSGSGKSVAGGFRDSMLKVMFSGENDETVAYDLGDDSSPQGLHSALIERDGRASLFSSDEAAGFFQGLGLKDWRTGLAQKITSWYGGWVAGSNKLSQKELRGKTALTSLSMHMFGTPEKVTETINKSMFEDGFMARVNWVIGNPAKDDDSKYDVKFGGEHEEGFYGTPPELEKHVYDLLGAVAHVGEPRAVQPGSGVQERMTAANKRMHELYEGRENWDNMLKPSLRRLTENMMKMSAINAIYRQSNTVELIDVLHALYSLEQFFQNLQTVAGWVADGDFQRNSQAIHDFIKNRGGVATRSAIFYSFRGIIERDPREIETLLTYLVESGLVNREEDGKGVRYVTNG